MVTNLLLKCSGFMKIFNVSTKIFFLYILIPTSFPLRGGKGIYPNLVTGFGGVAGGEARLALLFLNSHSKMLPQDATRTCFYLVYE